jgi:hypothetical protein
MIPMVPMPDAIVAIGAVERVGCRTPRSGGFLTGQHETGRSRSGQGGEPGRDELPSSALRIDDPLHSFVKFRGLDRRASVAFIPCLE